jgi:single-strand DNA-binding protein
MWAGDGLLTILSLSDRNQQAFIFSFIKYYRMNNIRNRVQLIGHLGIDPEVKSFDNNRKMARFSMATKDSYKDAQGNKVEQTEWHKIVIWGKQAELAESMLSKGMEVLVEGKLVHRQYTDKDGVKRNFTEVEASDFVMMGLKKAPAMEA